MKPVPTRGATHNYTAPANWKPEQDGECGDLSVRVQLHGARGILDQISTWKPSAEELARLNRGGVIELSVLAPVQPPVGMSVVDPVGEVIVDDVPGTHAITINEHAHGDDHG